MGCGLSQAARDAKLNSERIDREILESSEWKDKVVKILIVGAKGAGKNTIVKQLHSILLDSLGGPILDPVKDRRHVFHYLLYNMCDITNAMTNLNIEFENLDRIDDAQLIEDTLKTTYNNLEALNVSGEIEKALKRLWADDGVQEAFQIQRVAQCRLHQHAEYYFNNLNRICCEGYLPNTLDLILQRAGDIALMAFKCMYNNILLHVTKVGETFHSTKWFHCFEDAVAVVYIADLSTYDLVEIATDQTKSTRLQKSILHFEKVCNNKWFKDKPVILILNKKNIFRKKLASSPISLWFSNYTGTNTFEEASAFLQKEFEKLNHNAHKKIITCFTCGLDDSNIKLIRDTIWGVIKDEIDAS